MRTHRLKVTAPFCGEVEFSENGEQIERRVLHLPEGVKLEGLSLGALLNAPTIEIGLQDVWRFA